MDEKELFISAINSGDFGLVRDMIGNGASVNADFKTPLSCAIQMEQTDIVSLLIRSGADVNQSGLFGEAPLVVAVRTGNVDVVERILDAGGLVNGDADVGSKSGNKLAYTTPMHVAATQENPDILNVLLAANGNLGLRNYKHETPLHLAAYKGRAKNIERLVACGAGIEGSDKMGYMPLHHAVAEGHSDSVRALCKLGCSLNLPTVSGLTPLMVAIKKGHLGPLKTLLQFGPDLDRTESDLDRTAAHIVVQACPHRLGRKNVISINREIEMMESLVQAGADINKQDRNGETPAYLCVRTGCPSLLDYIIKTEGCKVDMKNKEGATPLTAACSMREHNAMIQILVQHCPLLLKMHTAEAACGEAGRSSLMYLLTERDNLPCMRLLLESGYKCSRSEAELCRELRENDPALVAFVDDCLLQPWPLQRICRLVIRELLHAQLHRKVFKLPIPQKLRDSITLQDIFIPK